MVKANVKNVNTKGLINRLCSLSAVLLAKVEDTAGIRKELTDEERMEIVEIANELAERNKSGELV